MLLEEKNAVIYGGGGAIGGAVARGLAREGARVFVAGRTQEPLEAVAADIRADGGRCDTAMVDALDIAATAAHADSVAAEAGSIDIGMTAIDHNDVQGTPMLEMAIEDYLAPVVTGVRASLVAWQALARHMVRNGGGVLLNFGGDGPPVRTHPVGGLQAGLAAVESMRRQLATELGEHGVRVVTLRTGGIPEAVPADFAHRELIEAAIAGQTLLGRAATLRDVGDVAAFVASDRARTMTAATVNVSCGTLVD